MTYTKPAVNVLGDAYEVIEIVVTKQSTNFDGGTPDLAPPAYDLDE